MGKLFCPHCGKELPTTEPGKYKFCPFCGENIEELNKVDEPEAKDKELPITEKIVPEKPKAQGIANVQKPVIEPEQPNKNGGCVKAGCFIGVILFFMLLIFLIATGNKKTDSAIGVYDDDTIDSIAPVDLSDDALATVQETKHKKEWDFTFKKDEMNDHTNIWATIYSDNAIDQDFPYGTTTASICVRYMKRYGYSVLIQISSGQINGREYHGTNYITARFDNGSAKKYYFNESSDGDATVVFLNNTSEFIKNCKKATSIKIDLPLYEAGRPVFTFSVDEPLVWRTE